MRDQYGIRRRSATKSPVVVRTRMRGQFVNIQDLQTQLYRDKDRTSSFDVMDYIGELIVRLEKLKDGV